MSVFVRTDMTAIAERGANWGLSTMNEVVIEFELIFSFFKSFYPQFFFLSI